MRTKLRWFACGIALLVASPAAGVAQGGATVAGRVTSATGTPIASAAVRIPAIGVAATTDADGSYTLNIPPGRVPAGQAVEVTASRVGFQAQSRNVTLSAGAATQDFQLAEDVLALEGIVATGIGQTTTRERLGVSIASVSGQQVSEAGADNVVAALAGKAPGVQVTTSSGDPGAAAYIRIRGVNTIGGDGQPLFVVDGIPVNNDEVVLPSSLLTTGGTSEAPTALSSHVNPNRIADLNPADIESVEILKGPAASAIYGAKAANGVVLITTKRGTPGATQVSLTTTGTVEQVNREYPLQRRFGQGLAGSSIAGQLRSWGPSLAGQQTFDHFGELFEDGRVLESNLSVSGGSDRTTYYLSLGGLDHNGVIEGSNDFFDRVTARLKGSHALSDRLTVNGNFAYSQSDGGFTQKGSNTSGLLLAGLRTPPDFDNCVPGTCFRTAEGFHRNYTNPNPTAIAQSGVFDNPFWVINENLSSSGVARAFGNVGVDLQALDWLRLNYTLGTDYSNDERLDRFPVGNALRATGYMQQATLTSQETDQNLVATATHDFNADVGGSLTLGWNRNARSFERLFAEGFDFVALDLYTLDNVLTTTPDNYEFKIHTESWFGQAQANLYDQLFLTAALRNDGFSTFGSSERRHWYPKLSAAWNVDRAIDLPANPVLSTAKLRAAWGQAGNEPPVYGTIGGLTSVPIADGGWGTNLITNAFGQGGVYSGITRDQPDLKPERTTETEVGADLALLNERLGLGVTYYNQHTRDAILAAPLTPSSGFFQQLQNAAEIRNRGWEVQADLRAVETPKFSWNVSGNWSTNDNRVLTLGDSATQFITMTGGFASATGAAVVGERVGVLRGNDFARCGRGLSLGGVDIDAACGGAPAGALYIGPDGFPILDPNTQVIADPHPDWTAGLSNTFTFFKNLQLSALLDIKHGGELWNGTRGALYSYGTHADLANRATCMRASGSAPLVCTGNEQVFGQGILPGAVGGPGAGMAVPIGENWYRTGLGTSFNGVNSQFIEDGGYVKLREAAINYSVPRSFARRLGMAGIDLRVAGRNLKTWTDYTGLDPETNVAGATNLRGIDYFNNPQTRQWIFTVGLNR
jgi:TonB-linked SusC/RagA family outer membrane protein